jgi:hypothetical protein
MCNKNLLIIIILKTYAYCSLTLAVVPLILAQFYA